MKSVRELDDELYAATYGVPIRGNKEEIWNSIKCNKDILDKAVNVVRNKFDEADILEGIAIADAMLVDYTSVDSDAYNKLINVIFSNTDIARLVLDGYSNGGCSFLLMALWNHSIKLTEEQKAFAVNEAMNKIGTTRWKNNMDNFSIELDNRGISDSTTTYINIDGEINPIGSKTKTEYMNYLFCSLSNKLAHGVGELDIRYQILRNPSWSVEEKSVLIYDFYENSDEYNEFLEQWEWNIINMQQNSDENSISYLDKDSLYDYTYEELFEFYGDRNLTYRVIEEIKFCRLMHKLRPMQSDANYTLKKHQ